jgi:hypothetical protein
MNIGDRVFYVGSNFCGLYGVELVVSIVRGPNTVACTFPEPDRPGGLGITTWLDTQDLLLEEVPAQP